MPSTTTDLTVANTIKAQLGARALFMLGAQNFLGDATTLTFKVRGSRLVTHIRITLTPMDTYTVTFLKVRGFNPPVSVAVIEDVYNDGLLQVIESNTGLRTSL